MSVGFVLVRLPTGSRVREPRHTMRPSIVNFSS